MVFSVSPSVTVDEIDQTNIIPAVSTSTGAMCGAFAWGPAEQITLIDNEQQLTQVFSVPNNTNFTDWLSASSFLSYASGLQVVRAIDSSTALNSSATGSVSGTGILIKNSDVYQTIDFSSSANLWVAKYPGVLGNSIGVAWCNAAGFADLDSAGEHTFPFADLFNTAPGANQFHVVVYDATGLISGTQGSVLETYGFVSTVTNAKNFDGSSAYFKTAINNASQWLWVGKTSLLVNSSNGVQLGGGADGAAITSSNREAGLVLFQNSETVDISLIFAAGGDATTSQFIIEDVAETRKDCVAFVSPLLSDTVNIFSDTTILSNISTTRTTYGDSSYAFMDSAAKYMYDRYNDVYRWVPLNGDMAGLCAQTDATNDPWFSPAGLNRGNIKNCLKLSWSQDQSDRDALYKMGVNPCVNMSNQGPILYGDKTLQTKASAFDRINVRRLFIVLEKAIATAAKFQLFELNDDVTRANFVNMVTPFLRDVKGRRGVYDFDVICDTTNNTPDIIDANRFVGDIYIKPARSINFINLNFIAIATGVNIQEVVVTQ